QVRERKKVLLCDLLHRLGIDPSDEELERHVNLGTPHKHPPSPDLVTWSRHWISNLSAANVRSARYDPRGLAAASGRIWIASCLAGMRGRNLVPVAGELLSSSLTLGVFNAEGLEWCAAAIRGLLG